jgi:DNA-binding transcriptional LysR family regulator
MQGELRQIADLALFAKIVQTGGISRCAADLGMERSTISRRLGALERTLGVKLLDRTPRYIAVTDAGRRCLEHCEQLLEAARHAQSLALTGSVVERTAPIVVGAPPDLLDRYIEPRLIRFETDNPGVRVDRQPVSIWTEQSLAAVDLGFALAPVDIDGSWTNTVAQVRQSVYASPEYAAQHRPLRSPFNIESHACIVEGSCTGKHTWRFRRDDKVTSVTVHARYVVSSLLEKREATLAGLGIARLPKYLCESWLAAGKLVDMMPEAELTGRDVVLISPRQRHRKSGTAALRMLLESAFSTHSAHEHRPGPRSPGARPAGPFLLAQRIAVCRNSKVRAIGRPFLAQYFPPKRTVKS